MRVYIAAPFFNEEQLQLVKDLEQALEDANVKYFSPRSEGVLSDMSRDEQENNYKRIFDSNVEHMNECSHMIAITEHKDTGTIFEMGYFCAQMKPIVMLTGDLSKVNVMLGQATIGICRKPEHAVNVALGLDIGIAPAEWT